MRRLILILLLFMITAAAQTGVRTEIAIPDLPGYLTLKCDFHTHTVFSDGDVWPSVRVREAWLEGLDAISITDHIEYLPHKNDVSTDLNRSFEIAKPYADMSDIILIRGTEITRGMPPGHLNAIFLNDAEPLNTDNWHDAVRAAADQSAFVFYNHPGWKAQQPDGIGKWYDEHQDLLDRGWLHGCEVVNGTSYYPEVLGWCLRKNLTALGNSDVHSPIHMSYDLNNTHRPMTLVFANSRSETGIRDALFAGRTAVYRNEQIIGRKEFLAPLFKAMLEYNESLKFIGKRAFWQLTNVSDVPLDLKLAAETTSLEIPAEISIPAHKSVGVMLVKKGEFDDSVNIEIEIENFIIAPDSALTFNIELESRRQKVDD